MRTIVANLDRLIKSCGAGESGAPGFQPGNTCSGGKYSAATDERTQDRERQDRLKAEHLDGLDGERRELVNALFEKQRDAKLANWNSAESEHAQARLFRSIAHATDAMPEHVLAKIERRVSFIQVEPTPNEVALASGWPADQLPAGVGLAGCYEWGKSLQHGAGGLYLSNAMPVDRHDFDQFVNESPDYHQTSVLAHEMTHALDAEMRLSASPEWQSIWRSEVDRDGGVLGAYARQHPAEGMAELGRAYWFSGVRRDTLFREMPRAMQYMVERGVFEPKRWSPYDDDAPAQKSLDGASASLPQIFNWGVVTELGAFDGWDNGQDTIGGLSRRNAAGGHQQNLQKDCGAGESGSPGFQPGNTCGGSGGSTGTSAGDGSPGDGADSESSDDSSAPPEDALAQPRDEYDEFGAPRLSLTDYAEQRMRVNELHDRMEEYADEFKHDLEGNYRNTEAIESYTGSNSEQVNQYLLGTYDVESDSYLDEYRPDESDDPGEWEEEEPEAPDVPEVTDDDEPDEESYALAGESREKFDEDWESWSKANDAWNEYREAIDDYETRKSEHDEAQESYQDRVEDYELMKEGRQDDIESLATNLERALDHAPLLEEPIEVYRGVGFENEHYLLNQLDDLDQTGQRVKFDTFASTSIDPEVARRFSSTAMFAIKAKTGAYVDHGLTSVPDERELIQNRDTEYMYHGWSNETVHDRSGNSREIKVYHLEELVDADRDPDGQQRSERDSAKQLRLLESRLRELRREVSRLKAKLGRRAGEIPSWRQLRNFRPLGGSTGALLADDSAGQQWVVKRGNSADHIRSEATANHLYRALEIEVPEQRLIEGSGSHPVRVAEYVPGTLLADLDEGAPLLELAVKNLQRHFVADAVLANWDVIGLEYDNIVVRDNGDVVRIDNGGSLCYRAQGKPKPFGAEVTELETMRQEGTASEVFGSVSDAEIAKQIDWLLARREVMLRAAPAGALRETLAARLDWLRENRERYADGGPKRGGKAAQLALIDEQLAVIKRERERFAKNCGAGDQGSPGFQPGNTCGGSGTGSSGDAGSSGRAIKDDDNFSNQSAARRDLVKKLRTTAEVYTASGKVAPGDPVHDRHSVQMRASLDRATKRMNDRVIELVDHNVSQLHVADNPITLSLILGDDPTSDLFGRTGGAYLMTKEGHAPVPGPLIGSNYIGSLMDSTVGFEAGDEHVKAAQVMAHELTHAIDNELRISGSDEWKTAWREEIGGADRPLGGYAASASYEGFAELGRAYWRSTIPKERLREKLPKCMAIWDRHGLSNLAAEGAETKGTVMKSNQPAKPAPQDANSPSNSEPMLEPLFNIGGFVNGWMRDGWREPKPGEPEIIYIDDRQQPANQPAQCDDSAPAKEQ